MVVQYNNELDYVEFKLGFELAPERYQLTKENKFLKLNLSNLELFDIKFLENLIFIEELDLSKNKIKSIYPLSTLISLKKLNLSDNSINDHMFLSRLTYLNELNLDATRITDLKPLSNLTSLTKLNLFFNRITDINHLSNLTSLKELNLDGTDIKDISPLSNLISLTSLQLPDNSINDISVLSKLTSLTTLRCFNVNNIKFLSSLTKLIDLSISVFDSTDIEVISKLTRLKKLYLKSSKSITPLKGLISLEVLSLSSNQLTDISALSNLTSLTSLNLYNNRLTDISPLSNLTSLTELYLHQNELNDISPLSNLTSLERLVVVNNPIKNVPKTILNSSAQEIIRWLKENEITDQKVLLNDVKILLLGNTNIGKSNLLFLWEQRYKKSKFKKKYPKNSISTHGLVYKEFSKDAKERNIPLLHIWDFGGQEYFHATHQLFFSPDALHVLLWSKGELDTRIDDEEIFELDYWLRCSEQLSKDESPIEMVLIENRIDYKGENDKLEFYSHFPDATYVEKFNIYSPHEETDSTKPPFMLNTCSVSLLYQKRLHGMFELLEERIDMLHQKNLHPPKYAEIRDVLDESKRKYWTLNQYKKRFREDDGIILQTLHRLGCLLYFHEQLPNKIFTQPDLLLNLIYDDILNENLQKNHGKLSNELEIAAKNKDLKIKEEELKSLLSAFKLIFQTKDGCWYAPQYLPEKSPAWLFLLQQHTFGFPNIIVTSDHYLVNSILLDIFTEYAGVIKKDNSYLFWQKGLVVEKDGQLLLIEYDRQQMCLKLYGDQQRNNQKLQKEVVDFIITTILFNNQEVIDYDILDNNEEKFELELSKENWSNNIVKVSVSIDGKYYVNVNELYDNVKHKIYNIKAFRYDDETQYKTFSVFQFNKYLADKDKGKMKKVTISYSKDDLKLVNEFIKNLVPLHDDGLIENPWYCSQLEAGSEWNKEIQDKFNQADIIFFMVSPNFLATKYIKEHEIKTAIARRQKEIEDKLIPNKQVKIIPIILDFCRWYRKDAKYNLGNYTALPYTAKPVMDFKNRNMAWYIIEEAIRVAIEKDNDPDFDTSLSKEVKKIYERIMDRRVDNDNVISE